MTLRSIDAVPVSASLAILSYCMIVIQELFLGVVLALTILSPYILWRQGDRGQAKVLFVLWGLIAAAVWVGSLEVIIPAIVVAVLGYIGWVMGAGRENI